MFKGIQRPEGGVVLISVLVISIVMMVFAISVLSLNVSQVTVGQHQVERIKADQYAKGIFWLNYTSLLNGTGPIGAQSEPLDNKTYSASVSAMGNGIYNTQRYDVTVSY